MKSIAFLLISALLISCGSESDDDGKPKLKPQIPQLNGARKINGNQLKQYMKKYESYANYFKDGLTFTSNEETYTVVKSQGKEIDCHYKVSKTKSIVKMTDTHIISFVDSIYSDVTPECHDFFQSGQIIEKETRTCFDNGGDISQLPPGLSVFVGKYVGREHFYVEFKGEGQTFQGMIDPMRSNFEEMIAEYTHVTGDYKYESSVTNSTFSEIDITGIDVAAYPQTEVTCENSVLNMFR